MKIDERVLEVCAEAICKASGGEWKYAKLAEMKEHYFKLAQAAITAYLKETQGQAHGQ
jgi:hypothetical protein